MTPSFLTRLGILFKDITGIKDISAMRKEIHKRIGKLIFHQKYSADDIIKILKSMGMTKGSTICIHAAMKEFYNYRGTAKELIEKIIEVITPEGTLIMPAFPNSTKIHDPSYIFDPYNDTTSAGYLAETFRNMTGVIRSINVQHSVCVWGKNANWLTRDHHNGLNCWDEYSPWYRMTQLNAIVFTLGLDKHYIGTFDHCVEGILYKEHPYWAQFFNKKQVFSYYNERKEVCHYTNFTGDIERRSREFRLIKHFNNNIHQKKKISNLLIKSFHSLPCLEIMIQLGRKGITMYYVPSTKDFCFG